jgi:phosphoglycerate dehydrogenase-like enzyme
MIDVSTLLYWIAVIMAQIVLFEHVHPSARTVFEAAGYTDIVSHAAALPLNELREDLEDAQIVEIRSRTQIDADILSKATQLRVLGCFCIGTNQVDLDAAMLRGIPVFNAPFSNTHSVAELVLGEAILLLRRIPEKMPASIKAIRTNLQPAPMKHAVKRWVSSATAILVRKSALWPKAWECA